MRNIYTVGYTAFKIDEFISVLKKYNITCVVDVRSLAYSQHYPDYNKEVLNKVLESNGIVYRNYSAEFGARQTEKCYFSAKGYLDFNKYVKSDRFESGYQKVLTGIDRGYTYVLMCAETDPIDCHRSIMIGREFFKRGFVVKNILKSGEILLQEELEKRLLDKYFSSRDQFSIFDNNNKDDGQLIEDAYDLRNEEIGYKDESENINYG
ncbi:MAG: DUF488 family protein [Sedimentibacter sp.]